MAEHITHLEYAVHIHHPRPFSIPPTPAVSDGLFPMKPHNEDAVALCRCYGTISLPALNTLLVCLPVVAGVMSGRLDNDDICGD